MNCPICEMPEPTHTPQCRHSPQSDRDERRTVAAEKASAAFVDLAEKIGALLDVGLRLAIAAEKEEGKKQ